MSFGEILIKARENAGLKQKDLAALIFNKDGKSISAAFLSDLEHDLRKPSDYLIDQLATVLEISTSYLYHCAGKLPPSIRSFHIDIEKEKEVEKLYQELQKELEKYAIR